jgi:putative FmdB family regulatory protein
MPIYEYECKKCGKIHEVFQKFSDRPLTQCKKCSGKLHKLISHSSFHLKGTGWYVTDYATGSRPNSNNSNKEDASKTADRKKSSSQKKTSKTSADPSEV